MLTLKSNEKKCCELCFITEKWNCKIADVLSILRDNAFTTLHEWAEMKYSPDLATARLFVCKSEQDVIGKRLESDDKMIELLNYSRLVGPTVPLLFMNRVEPDNSLNC